MKTATPVEILSYSVLLSKVAEEQGGVRTAYQYDVLVRTAMAKALEAGDPAWNVLFTKVDRDLAKEAKDKIMAKASETARFTHGKGDGKGKAGKGGASGYKGGGEPGSSNGAAGPAGSSSRQSLSPTAPPRSRSPWPRKQQDSWNQGGGWQQKGWQQKKK